MSFATFREGIFIMKAVENVSIQYTVDTKWLIYWLYSVRCSPADRRQCQDIAGTCSWISVCRYFCIYQQAVHSSHCSYAVSGHTAHRTGGSSSIPVLPFETWVTEAYIGPFLFQMVSSKCSCSLSPLLLCLCLLKRNQVSNLDQTPADRPYTGLIKRDNCFVSTQTLACHASCVSLLMWEDYGEFCTLCFFVFF